MSFLYLNAKEKQEDSDDAYIIYLAQNIFLKLLYISIQCRPEIHNQAEHKQLMEVFASLLKFRFIQSKIKKIRTSTF